MMRLLLLSLLLASPVFAANYTRAEYPYTPGLHVNAGSFAKAMPVDWVALELYPLMTAQERWFIAREIEFLNKDLGLLVFEGIIFAPVDMQIIVPVYQRTDKFIAGDIRNWQVAVMKGRKYGIHPALMIAVRTQENPLRRRDRYAYGVVIKRYTNLWTQAEWGARIIARIAKSQGWSPMEPTCPRLLRLARVYVGQGERSADNWSRNVWTLFNRALD